MTGSVDLSEFRRWMGRFPTGVTVVTARDGDRSFGLTVNAFLSVSLNPPLVLISLSDEADTTPVVRRTGRFAVNVLAAPQRSVSERFAETIPPEEKFANVAVRSSPGGLPWIVDTVGRMECAVERAHVVADHILFVGRVVAIESGPNAAPLVFLGGRYVSAQGSEVQRVPPEKR
jgi:flavin reductase (DIM6/NTAB) family NADH-FMN oxidoreductase RutF